MNRRGFIITAFAAAFAPKIKTPLPDIPLSRIRRMLPSQIAYDICGVQPMTGPTGLIFAMRSRYKTMQFFDGFSL